MRCRVVNRICSSAARARRSRNRLWTSANMEAHIFKVDQKPNSALRLHISDEALIRGPLAPASGERGRGEGASASRRLRVFTGILPLKLDPSRDASRATVRPLTLTLSLAAGARGPDCLSHFFQ